MQPDNNQHLINTLVHNTVTHQTARVLRILPDPFWIEGIHSGEPAQMAYVSPDEGGYGDYWHPAHCVAELELAKAL